MSTPVDPGRARGMLIAAAAGDALGWPQEMRGGLVGGQKARDARQPAMEFTTWTRTAGRYSGRYRDPVAAGEYSDDTQLLCATARACLTGDRWWQRLVEAELPAWPAYQRGGGGAVLSAAAAWADQRPPWAAGTAKARTARDRYWNAGANGAAMRIAPHAVHATGPELAQRVIRDGSATHGHPRALVGAAAYAAAMSRALRSASTLEYGDLITAAASGIPAAGDAVAALPPDWGTAADVDRFAAEWERTITETHTLLDKVSDSLGHGALSNAERTLKELGCTDPSINGAGTVTAAAAVYLASRFAARPSSGLLAGAFLPKGDTDTLASMAGALLGAIHGTGWLGPLARNVQDAAYLTDLADGLVARHSTVPPQPTEPPALLRKRLERDLPPHGNAGHGEFPDGRRYRVLDTADIGGGRATRTRLLLDDGQTGIVDRPVNRKSTPPSTQPPHELVRAAATGGYAVRLSLATEQLRKSAAFYAQLLGTEITVSDGQASVAPWLVLRHAVAGPPPDGRLVITIVVPDAAEAAARIEGSEIVNDGNGFRTRDPDGRHLRVEESSPRPSPL